MFTVTLFMFFLTKVTDLSPWLNELLWHLQCSDSVQRHSNASYLTTLEGKCLKLSVRNIVCMELAEAKHRGASFGPRRNVSVTWLESKKHFFFGLATAAWQCYALGQWMCGMQIVQQIVQREEVKKGFSGGGGENICTSGASKKIGEGWRNTREPRMAPPKQPLFLPCVIYPLELILAVCRCAFHNARARVPTHKFHIHDPYIWQRPRPLERHQLPRRWISILMT